MCWFFFFPTANWSANSKENRYICIPVVFSQSFHSPIEFYASWRIYALTYLFGERGAKMFPRTIFFKFAM